ncbi:uncharacterized protein LOC141507281 [Macrotis lagotis]|uniref:uncharacterized protein LOC141507281 n=1 Tax=Macrotis lagotis TaxID=92651 RepID=UPI003D68D8BB
MERKPRIFPKELVHFPRKGLQNKTKSVLLPCPPHRISPLWEKTYKTRTEQVPHLSYQAKVTETSSASPFLRDAKRLSSIAVPRKIASSSHLPHTDLKAMTTLLPCLHRGLAKTSPRHKHNAFTSVMPFPRSNCKVKKTALKFSDKQYLMPLPDYKNNLDYLLDLDQISLDNSGSDHLPKIFPGYKNRTEAITNPDQKALAPIPYHVSLCEGDKTGSGLVCRPCLDSQTEATPESLTTTQYTKTSLRNKQNQVRAASMVLGFNKKGDKPTSPNSSHCPKNWFSAKTIKSLDLFKMLEKSYSDPRPKNMVSLAYPESRFLTSSFSHHNQKTRVTIVTSPDHQAEHIQVATSQVTLSMGAEPWEEISLPRADDQTATMADQDHVATFLLNQDSSEDCTISSSVSEAEDLQDPNIHFRFQAEQDQQGKMTEEMEHQAIIPEDKHHETTNPFLVLQDTSAGQWVKLSPSQIKTTQRLFGHISVQTDQKSFTHASVQTEQESWQTISSRIDHQITILIGSDHGTTPSLGLNPKVENSDLNYHTTSAQIPDHQVTGNIAINPPVTLQARQDHLGEMEQEIDLDGIIFLTGQDHGPLELGPQDKSLHDSDYQEEIVTGQDPKIIPPMTLGSQKEILPESNPQATFLTNSYHFSKQSQDHLVCFSVQKEYEALEIMSKIDQEEYGTASILGLDSKNTLQDDLDQKTTSLSTPDHLAEDLPILDIQIKYHGELVPCGEIAVGTHHQNTILIDQGPRAIPPLNLDPQDKSLLASYPWVTTPLDQDHGITAQLVLIQKNKALPEPDQWSTILTNPHHQNQAIQDYIPEISLQINQEKWQKMPSRIDQQATVLTGQDHGVTKPLLVLDIKDTLSPSLAHQAMSPPCSDHQAENIPDPNVQFAVLEHQDSLGEMVQETYHQSTILADQNHGTISPGNLDPQDKILSASDPQNTIVRYQDHETSLSSTLGPQNKTLIKSENSVKPLQCPYLAGNHQDQIPQTLLQTEQDLQETIPAGTSDQSTKLKVQDQETIPPLTFRPQNKTLLEIDLELSTPPHHQDKDTPNHVAKISIQTEQESVKMMPPRLCHQHHQDYGTTPLMDLDPKATSPTRLDLVQDYGTIPLVDLESRVTNPTGLEYWATSQHNPNQQDKIIIDQNTQVTLQACLNHWETISKEKDLNLINVTDEDFLELDNQETTQLDQVEDIQYPKVIISPQSEQDHWESLPQGVEAKDKTFTSQAISLLTLGLQDQTPPLSDHQTILQTNPKYSVEDTSDSVIHICPEMMVQEMMVQEDLEIPSIVKNQQVVGPSDQETETPLALGLEEDKVEPGLYQFTCLPSFDHQSEGPPASNIDASTQTEQDSWKTMPQRKDSWAKAQIDIDHKTTPLVGLDQNEALTGTKYEVKTSSSPYKQTEEAQSPITYISFQTDPVPWETILPIMDKQTTTLKAQNETILHKTLPGSSYQDTNMLSTDQQAGDIQRLIARVLLQMKRGYWEMPPKIDHHQNTTLKGQGNETILLLNLDSQDETLPQDTREFIPDQKMEPPENSSAHVSFQIEPKSRETIPPRIDHQVTSSMGWVNGSVSSLSSVPRDQNQPGSDHQVIISPVNPNYAPEVVPDLQTHVIAPSNNYHMPKSLMNLNHKIMSKSVASLKPGQSKQNPWCFKYIKAYTADRATITTEIIHTIIRSIPQERIRNDISKQILLKRMKVSSALHSGHQISSSYPVCLICASWIPDNCPHVQRMKYPCKAQLLAIPIPLPSCKEYMGVKFVLQIPQAKCFRFILPEIYYISQMPSCHSTDSLPSSYPGSVRSPVFLKHEAPVPSPSPERIKGLSSYIVNKYHQPGERATFRSQQSPTGTGYMKEYSSRADEPRRHPVFFRSLLERFQLKQKVN